MQKTNLCEVLAKQIRETHNDDLLYLMGVCYTITLGSDEPSLRELLPLYNIMLYSASFQLREPTFLCISAFSVHSPTGINYNKLVDAAAFFISTGSKMSRQLALKIIQEHVTDKTVNLESVLKIFIQNFKQGDEIVEMAIDSFAKAVQQKRVTPGTMQKMSVIYKSIHHKSQ